MLAAGLRPSSPTLPHRPPPSEGSPRGNCHGQSERRCERHGLPSLQPHLSRGIHHLHYVPSFRSKPLCAALCEVIAGLCSHPESPAETRIKGGGKQQPLPIQRREAGPQFPQQRSAVQADSVPKHPASWGLACHPDTMSTWDAIGIQAKVASGKMEASGNHNIMTTVG